MPSVPLRTTATRGHLACDPGHLRLELHVDAEVLDVVHRREPGGAARAGAGRHAQNARLLRLIEEVQRRLRGSRR